MDTAPINNNLIIRQADIGKTDTQATLPKNPEMPRVTPSKGLTPTSRVSLDNLSNSPTEGIRSVAQHIGGNKSEVPSRLQGNPDGINVQDSAEEIAMSRAMLRPQNHREDPMPESARSIDLRKGANDLSAEKIQDKNMNTYKGAGEISSSKDAPMMVSTFVSSERRVARQKSAEEAKKSRFKRVQEKPRRDQNEEEGKDEEGDPA